MALCKVFLLSILIIIPHISSLNFSFPSFRAARDSGKITFEGSAFMSNDALQMTPNEPDKLAENKIGQARYVKPVNLWDKASGNLTDFETHFTFTISTPGVLDGIGEYHCFADGLAFFLAPNGTHLQDSSFGGNLGLLGSSLSYPFLAVEFDTFQNPHDPYGYHVGIDISSVTSNATTPWEFNVSIGNENEVWITYDSTIQNLSVTFTGTQESVTHTGELNFLVNPINFLPEWVDVGFSAATGDCFELIKVTSWSFSSSLQLDEVKSNFSQQATPLNNTSSVRTPPQTSPRKMKTGQKIGLAAGVIVVILVLALTGYIIWKKTKKSRDGVSIEMSIDEEIGKSSGPKKFSYEQLVQATDNFSEDNKLGEGGFGMVYKGFSAKLHAIIAVKRRISGASKQGEKEYISEVKTISQLRHRNLVQLIGWCHEKNELLLVYEFMPNSSLDIHLFKGVSLLTWTLRWKIVRGVASGLVYLHEEWEQCVLHRDLKSSNIMLDSGFNAKIGDFGMARLLDHEKEAYSTRLAGTLGYMAPEYLETWKASKETDVYSFGVVLLEIACGRRPFLQDIKIVEWVWKLYATGDILKAADPKLCYDFDNHQMECLLIVGLWCAHPISKSRPSIKSALNVLSFESPLPTLPLKMPVPFENVSSPVSSQTYSLTASGTSGSNFTNSSNFQSDPFL